MTPTPRTPDPCQNCADRREREAVLYRVIAAAERRAEKAESQIAVLREALEYEASLHPYPADVPDIVRQALNSPDSAAKEYESRIRADAVKPWRAALAWTLTELASCIIEDEMSSLWLRPYKAARSLLDHTGEGESG